MSMGELYTYAKWRECVYFQPRCWCNTVTAGAETIARSRWLGYINCDVASAVVYIRGDWVGDLSQSVVEMQLWGSIKASVPVTGFSDVPLVELSWIIGGGGGLMHWSNVPRPFWPVTKNCTPALGGYPSPPSHRARTIFFTEIPIFFGCTPSLKRKKWQTMIVNFNDMVIVNYCFFRGKCLCSNMLWLKHQQKKNPAHYPNQKAPLPSLGNNKPPYWEPMH